MEGIELIKDKVFKGDTRLTSQERLVVEQVYFDITKLSTGKGKYLSKDCQGCLPSVYKIIKNYVNYHMPKLPVTFDPSRLKKVDRSKNKVSVITVNGEKHSDNMTDIEAMPMDQMRRYAKEKLEIKFSNNISREKLIEKIEAHGNKH